MGSNGDRKIHLVSKKVLGFPKSEGGLGFRSFKSFNDALLAKQCYRLISEPNSLWASVLRPDISQTFLFLMLRMVVGLLGFGPAYWWEEIYC